MTSKRKETQAPPAPIRYSICQKCGKMQRWTTASAQATTCKKCGGQVVNPNT